MSYPGDPKFMSREHLEHTFRKWEWALERIATEFFDDQAGMKHVASQALEEEEKERHENLPHSPRVPSGE